MSEFASDFDLGPLTWVKGEIDLALERAGEALREFEQKADPTEFKFCRTHIHQVHGALAIVGLDGVTRITETLETLLEALENGSCQATSVTLASIGRALAGLRQYLDDLVAGEPNQPLRLLDSYQDLMTALGRKDSKPSDLFFPDLGIRPPKRSKGAPLAKEALQQLLRSRRHRFQKGLLAWLRNPPGAPESQSGCHEMLEALTQIEATQDVPAARAFWWSALAFVRALGTPGAFDANKAKPVCARIDLQIRRLFEGSSSVAERLQRDVLYFIAQAPADLDPRIAEIKSAYQLDRLIPSRQALVAQTPPQEAALRRLRESILTTEEQWNRFCAGSATALASFAEHARSCAQLTAELAHTDFKRLGQALAATANWLSEQPSRHNETVGMEVATAIMLLHNAQEHFKHLGQDFAQQVDVMVARLHACIAGNVPAADTAIPLLDEFSRRAQEKLLLGQVAREIQNSLAQVEQTLDAFFRDPAKRPDAATLETPLKHIRGALSMLGHDDAVAYLQNCAERIVGFADPASGATAEDYETVAHELSTLGFFVDALQSGHADFKEFMRQLGVDDEASEVAVAEEPEEEAEHTVESQLEQLKQETRDLMLRLKSDPADEQAREDLNRHLRALEKDADLVADQRLLEQARAALEALALGDLSSKLEDALGESLQTGGLTPAAPSAETLKLAQASGAEIDAELLDIFLEEAHEVLQTIGDNLQVLRENPHDSATLTTIRRSTHTLKGSGRMVGLSELGETAWALEQTLNLWLRQEKLVDAELIDLIQLAHTLFSVWIEHLASGDGLAPDPSELIEFAERLRGEVPAIEPLPTTSAPAKAQEVPDALVRSVVQGFDLSLLNDPAETPIDSADSTLDALQCSAVPEPETLAVEAPDLPTEEAAPATTESAPQPAAPDEVPAELTASLVQGFDLSGLDAQAEDSAPEPEMLAVEALDLPAEETAPPATESALLPAAPEEGPVELTASLVQGFDLSGLDAPAEDAAPEPEMLAVEALDLPTQETAPTAAAETPLPAAQEEEPSELAAADHGTPASAEADAPTATEEALPAAITAPEPVPATVEQTLSVSPVLYEIFREEAGGHLANLERYLSDIELAPAATTPFEMCRAAHTLAGISATVGLMTINKLGLALEHALLRRDGSAHPEGLEGLEALRCTVDTLAAMMDGLQQQQTPLAQDELVAKLEVLYPVAHNEEEIDVGAASVAPAAVAPASAMPVLPTLQDELDEQLLPIFLEEAEDLVGKFTETLHDWRQAPGEEAAPQALARLLHTFKGGARMAGAMNLGELTHAVESRLQEAIKAQSLGDVVIDDMEAACDTLSQFIDALAHGEAPTAQPLEATTTSATPASATTGETSSAPPVATAAKTAATPTPHANEGEGEGAQTASLRVRADLIDQLVNEAGELSIARSRIEGEMRSLKEAMLDLTENVIRLRRQLRELEIQAESQIQARVGSDGKEQFDPLELDRFTRSQELTRMMAESVNDVSTVQQTLLKNLDDANAAITAQARLNHGLQQSLMSIRMLPFQSQAERLYRIVRQTAKETGKRANLDIRGGQVELDRSVLEKIMAPLEHMLRNAIAHGLEDRDGRRAAGKRELGEITLSLNQEGNEVVLGLSDDGRGLDLAAIRSKAEEQGLLAAGEEIDDAHLTDFIFHAGFSTAASVSQLAGRGVGMDVVKTEVTALGGRIEVLSQPGHGTSFRLYLPLTLAVTQTLLIRIGSRRYAIPSTMIEQVLELKAPALATIQNQGKALWMERNYPFYFLPQLLGDATALPETHRQYWVLLLRSGSQRVAVLVDELLGNQETVVKNIGPQVARVVGVAGATVLGDGQVILILNPVALANRGIVANTAAPVPMPVANPQPAAEAKTQPTVMVVDDSLTVRKITGRLLTREGYQLILAKDGVDALEHLIDVVPDVILSDIEMPRMDGFDLVRNIRADARLRNIPIIMITSRTADKHRNHAMQIGANHYLGKPYNEEELLRLVAQYTA